MSYIPTILENFLGPAKSDREDVGEALFDCIECDNGRHKGNLVVNYHKGVFKCWSCKETNDMYGTLNKLVYRYGSKSDIETYRLIKPTFDYNAERALDVSRFVEKPKGSIELSQSNTKEAEKVKKYLYQRGIDDKMISDFKMMFSNEVGFKGRVIIPSLDETGNIEYYIARAIYDVMSIKYNNPEADKNEFIFFESRINWSADIYLVEGVFDSIVIPNSIPMLGKVLFNKLEKNLRDKAKANIVIILDDDAYDDAVKLYHTLNLGNLANRVKLVKLTEGLDPSKLYEKEGKRGIINLLSSAYVLT